VSQMCDIFWMWPKSIFFLNGFVSKKIKLHFYLPHMEYEGSIGLVSRKMKKKFADFHFLGLFMNK
jgi:hypothetical protein